METTTTLTTTWDSLFAKAEKMVDLDSQWRLLHEQQETLKARLDALSKERRAKADRYDDLKGQYLTNPDANVDLAVDIVDLREQIDEQSKEEVRVQNQIIDKVGRSIQLKRNWTSVQEDLERESNTLKTTTTTLTPPSPREIALHAAKRRRLFHEKLLAAEHRHTAPVTCPVCTTALIGAACSVCFHVLCSGCAKALAETPCPYCRTCGSIREFTL